MTIIVFYIEFFKEFLNACNFRKIERGEKGTEIWHDLDIILLPFDDFSKKNQDTLLSEVLCKLILIIYRSIVSHGNLKKNYFNVRLILVLKLISSGAL